MFKTKCSEIEFNRDYYMYIQASSSGEYGDIVESIPRFFRKIFVLDEENLRIYLTVTYLDYASMTRQFGLCKVDGHFPYGSNGNYDITDLHGHN